ncbi:efflux transporter outer membrane subunit [Rhodopseudomonas palustris]|uniref:RND efflux system, outer membrane lipoprotein, NodT n=1 Tax=Rhodopseudomonas palustris (strain BisB18) TaxID=316056 RepID=Q210Q1_RHOPB
MVNAFVRSIAFLPLAASLGGCLVGPDYAGPPLAAPLAETGQGFRRLGSSARALEPSADWWRAIRDPMLTELIERALADSPSIQIVEARVRQARASAREQYANLLPSGSVAGAYLHNRIPLGDARRGLENVAGGQAIASQIPDGTNLDLYDTNFDASWEIDIFGGRQRAAEQAVAQADAAVARFADAQVQLAAQVAQSYVGLRDAQHRLDLTLQSVKLQQEAIDLTAQRLGGGTTSDLDLERLRTQLASTEAMADPLRATIDRNRGQLAVLVGLEPGTLDSQLRQPRPVPVPPRPLRIGDPAGMLRRRPDIREAERNLAATNAQIGQAVAGYFPRVTLLGNVGSVSTSTAVFGTAGSLIGNVGPTLQWNVLDFGRTLARIRQAEAGSDAAIAQYQNTVLTALQDAESSLSRFSHQRSQVAKLARASASADKAAELMRQRNRAGTVSVIDLLDVERQRLQTVQSLAQAQAQLMNDYIALQKSLGLGWSDAPAPEVASSKVPDQ